MLKISSLLSNNKLKFFLLNNNNLNHTKRLFNYQTQIYVNKFELPIQKELKDELKNVKEMQVKQPNLSNFVNAYRKSGYKAATKLDPLSQYKIENLDTLSASSYGLNYDDVYDTSGILFNKEIGNNQMTVKQIEEYLKETYSNNICIEFDFISNEEEKLWLAKEFEQLKLTSLDAKTKVDILKLLLKSEVFDHFLASKFPTFKRYSNEGAESTMAFYQSVFSTMATSNIEDLVMGIAHRGRLNLMVCLLNLDPNLLFTKMKGKHEFSDDVTATGDIAHHYPISTELSYDSKQLHVSLLQNPSHLEAVNPLVIGKARSKQMIKRDCFYSEPVPQPKSNKVASFLVHGDAAFAGQGIVAETFQLSKLPNYGVGGTVHLITNNQLGFTTPSSLGRSGNFNSDLAKGFDCPIIHVNGDYPELAYKAASLAAKYRNKFAKDILVDLICFRKYGHNELDDPSFTNPSMYKLINSRASVPSAYENKIVNEEKLIMKDVLNKEIDSFHQKLNDALAQVVSNKYAIEPRNTYLRKQWSEMSPASNKEYTEWFTGCDVELLKEIGKGSVTYPENFTIHPTIERAHVKKRIERINSGKNIDWSTAEALAIGSLLLQEYNVRISGQDVGRGTFSQRHALLVNQATSQTFIPLNNLKSNQKNFFEICNSFLSEEAVMGFDYGFSLDNPKNLVIWEAQFGDFFNGAQIIIDTYISCGEAKWMHQSGLVLLMPHGFDGAGPDHSSCRIERFLQMSSSKEDAIDSDDVNYRVVHPTTPANYFHLLRRQMLLPYRKPLIVASPKTLLRLPECVSTLNEFDSNTQFKTVIDDPTIKAKESVKRLIFVFGKHYYTLQEEKKKRNLSDVAIIRIEELCPFPTINLREVLKQYKNAKEFIWSQEEHRNMGAWFFVSPRFENILGVKLRYTGRDVHSTVVGTALLHSKEVSEVLSKPFEKI